MKLPNHRRALVVCLLHNRDRTRRISGGIGENGIQAAAAVAEGLNARRSLLIADEQIFSARIEREKTWIGFRGERRITNYSWKSGGRVDGIGRGVSSAPVGNEEILSRRINDDCNRALVDIGKCGTLNLGEPAGGTDGKDGDAVGHFVGDVKESAFGVDGDAGRVLPVAADLNERKQR